MFHRAEERSGYSRGSHAVVSEHGQETGYLGVPQHRTVPKAVGGLVLQRNADDDRFAGSKSLGSGMREQVSLAALGTPVVFQYGSAGPAHGLPGVACA
jgi:hypothetical protein